MPIQAGSGGVGTIAIQLAKYWMRYWGQCNAMHQSTEAAQGANAQADQAGEFLGSTVELIATINAMNTQIASAAEEQTSVAEEPPGHAAG